jgi:Ca-activated chloride channel family protein
MVSIDSLMTTPKPQLAGTPTPAPRESSAAPAKPKPTDFFYSAAGEAIPDPAPVEANLDIEQVSVLGSQVTEANGRVAGNSLRVDDYGFMDQKPEGYGMPLKEAGLADKSGGVQAESEYKLRFGAADTDMPMPDSTVEQGVPDGVDSEGEEDLFAGVKEGSLGFDDNTMSPGDEMSLAEYPEEAADEGDRSEWLMRAVKPAVFNPYILSAENAFSTFSIDVDTASYGLARQRLLQGGLPEPEQVRTEEFINSFDYDYRPPSGKQTFAVHTEMAPSPFRLGMDTLKIGVKGRRIGRDDHRGAVLTLVVDTSGSMSTPERLGLVKESLALLIDQLNPEDSVAIVQFGSEARLVLEHTPASEKAALLAAINALQPGGPTQFDKGLELGYQLAEAGFRAGDSNRIMILSDGVANLGELDPEAILAQVAEQRKQGIYLSVLGFGAGTYDDDLLERLANKGDGMYAYIDTLDEARHLLVDQLAATLHVIASDVKIQVEFNPERVVRYRQLGYENRQLTKEQFRDDTVDAGEVGSGQSVTALYDVELNPARPADEPIATVYVRYRRADNGAVEEISSRVTDVVRVQRFKDADTRFQLSVCAAEFAERLRRSPYTEGTEIEDIAGRLQPVTLELSLDGQVQELKRLISIAASLEK